MLHKIKLAILLPLVFAFELLKYIALETLRFGVNISYRFGLLHVRFSVTNPSNLFIPEVCMEYAGQRFTESLGVMQELIGPIGSGKPIEMQSPIMGFGDQGQYYQLPTFVQIGDGLVSRRDITSNSDTTPVNLTGVNEIAVKVNRRIGPLDYTKDALRLTKATPAAFSAEVGRQIGMRVAKNIQNSIVAAALGVIGGVTAAANTLSVWSATVRTNMSPDLLAQALFLMGDVQEEFRASARILMRSDSYYDLNANARGRSYQGVGDRALSGADDVVTLGMGKPVVVDNSGLTVTDAGFDKLITLILGAGFMRVWFPLPITMYDVFQTTLPEQVLDRMRGDFDFCIGCPGVSYNTGGGANPTDATIATTSNWTPNFYRHQEVRGLEIVHNASLGAGVA